jgi:hypothetical protein
MNYNLVSQAFQFLSSNENRNELLKMAVKKEDKLMVKKLLFYYNDDYSLLKPEDMELLLEENISDQLLSEIFGILVKSSVENKKMVNESKYTEYDSGEDYYVPNVESQIVFLNAILKFDRLSFFKLCISAHQDFINLICSQKLSEKIGEYKSYRVLNYIRENKIVRSRYKIKKSDNKNDETGFELYVNTESAKSIQTLKLEQSQRAQPYDSLVDELRVLIGMFKNSTTSLKDEQELQHYLLHNHQHFETESDSHNLILVSRAIKTLSMFQHFFKYFPLYSIDSLQEKERAEEDEKKELVKRKISRESITLQENRQFLLWGVDNNLVTVDEIMDDQMTGPYGDYYDGILHCWFPCPREKMRKVHWVNYNPCLPVGSTRVTLARVKIMKQESTPT